MNAADLSIETLQARREWQDILRVMKENNLETYRTKKNGRRCEGRCLGAWLRTQVLERANFLLPVDMDRIIHGSIH